MRPVICALFAVIASACTAFAAARVTLILQFEAQHSESSVNEMKRELQNLMRGSGVELNWRSLDDTSASDSFPSVVIVTFHGTCVMNPLVSPLPSEPVALAYAHVSNGTVIPFADVECDRVRSALTSTPGARSELLFGRALGRVLGHELHHIIERTRAHTQHGITRKSLSGRDLIADRT
ncbi:MAG: hypothetical protein LAP39_14475 [Acidobacteriia bacterium]|nr:hypothetical protein [Terriglobia bacterium]